MNGLMKWFYDKQEKNERVDMGVWGLEVVDTDKWHAHLVKASKSSMMGSFVFFLFVLFIIFKWVQAIIL